jgi:hypothetical protein
MKRMIKILAISLVIGGILAAVLAGTVFAAGPSGGQNTARGAGEESGWGGRGLGFGPDKAVSELLGMTPEEIREQRQAGKSLVEIAATGNITEEALINAIMADKEEAIRKLLAAGTIAQSQADERLEQMRDRVQLAVNRTMTGPPDWARANDKGKNHAEKGNYVEKGYSGERGNGAMRQGGMKGNQAGGRGMSGGSTDNNIQEQFRTQGRIY